MNSLTKVARLNFKYKENLFTSVKCLHSSGNLKNINFLPSSEISSIKHGAGGRCSWSGQVVTIFGATGKFGSTLVNVLAGCGTQIILPFYCDPYECDFLKGNGDLGQVLFSKFDLEDEDTIRRAMQHSNVVINLLGREWETRNYTFERIHVEGAQKVARISKEMGIEKLIHFSALNCDSNEEYLKEGGSGFLSSKYKGELAVRNVFPEAVIFRPSDMIAKIDYYTSHYLSSSRYFYLPPVSIPFEFKSGFNMPLARAGKGIFKQPVLMRDVALGVAKVVFGSNHEGKTYKAVGPRIYELRNLIDYIGRVARWDALTGFYIYDIEDSDMAWVNMIYNEWKAKFKPHSKVGLHSFTRDKIEREAVSDDKCYDSLLLSDLGVETENIEIMVHHIARRVREYQSEEHLYGGQDYVVPPKFSEAWN